MVSGKQEEAKEMGIEASDVNGPQDRQGIRRLMEKWGQEQPSSDPSSLAQSMMGNLQQDSSCSSLPKREVQSTGFLEIEDLGHVIDRFHSTLSSVSKSQHNNRQDKQDPSHETQTSLQDEEKSEPLNDCGRCFMASDEAEPTQLPVHETRVVQEDPTIKLLRQRIQEEQKLESVLEVAQVRCSRNHGHEMIAMDHKGEIMHQQLTNDCYHSPSMHTYLQIESNSSIVPEAKVNVSGDALTRKEQQQHVKSSIASRNDKGSQSCQYYNGNEDDDNGDDCAPSFLLCDDSIGDWMNYNSLQYQFI